MHECLNIQWSDNHGASLKREDFLTINVSGTKYETLRSTLRRFPDSLLGNSRERLRYFIPSKNMYFFNRCRQSFEAILYYYQTGGILTRPVTVPMKIFEEEVLFYQLGSDVLLKLHQDEGFQVTTNIDETMKAMSQSPYYQRKLWELFENPNSSCAAKFISLWSMFVIGVSVTVFCLETLPEFKTQVYREHVEMRNRTARQRLTHAHGETQPWFSLELFCVVWFTIEYVARFLSSPSKYQFITSFLNTVDFLAVAPYFIIMGINSGGDITPLSVLRAIRLVRVFRIFKLSRHSMSLKILGHTLRESLRELGMLVFFLLLGVLLFSSALYYAEHGTEDTFSSIPDSFWYGIVTMTTIGYGDVVPKTRIGKLIGSICTITGVLALALPVPVIVSNFEFFYKRERLEDLTKSKKKKIKEKKRNTVKANDMDNDHELECTLTMDNSKLDS